MDCPIGVIAKPAIAWNRWLKSLFVIDMVHCVKPYSALTSQSKYKQFLIIPANFNQTDRSIPILTHLLIPVFKKAYLYFLIMNVF